MTDNRKNIPLTQHGRPQPPQDAAEADREAAAPKPVSFEDQTPSTTPAGDVRVFNEDIIEALRHVHDPEIPVNIYDLGLIYDLDISDDNDVRVTMTLTTPNCPEAQNIPRHIQEAIHQHVPGVGKVTIDLVWQPRWTREMMSEDAKLALDMF